LGFCSFEDVVLSKLFALNAEHLRAKDLDDLQSIFGTACSIDIDYLSGQMRQFGVTIPRTAEPFLPDELLRISRDIARSARRPRRP